MELLSGRLIFVLKTEKSKEWVGAMQNISFTIHLDTLHNDINYTRSRFIYKLKGHVEIISV